MMGFYSLTARRSRIRKREMPLTGRFNLRKTFTGRIVLVVEEETKSLWSRLTGNAKHYRRWRDATVLDLAAPELRNLIDQRFRPHYLTPIAEISQERSQGMRPLEAVPRGALYHEPLDGDGRTWTAH